MRQLNNEQRAIVDNILYQKIKNPTKPFHIFLIDGVGTGKMFTLMCIIQNMLLYYTKQITNVDPLKPKIMKLTYIRKTTFNTNGTTIHSAFAIPLNKNLTKLNALSDERRDTFIKTYDQLCLLVIDEVSLVGNRMLSFINHILCIIKQVHNEFVGGLNVIMTGDFYQAPPSSRFMDFQTNNQHF
jgi:hypothetical protein